MQGYFGDRLADDVADDLQAKAIVLQDDDTAIAIVVCDIIGTYKEYIDIARARAAELTGIPVGVMAGKKCPECGAHAMIRKDGCDYCTQCGHLGSCG